MILSTDVTGFCKGRWDEELGEDWEEIWLWRTSKGGRVWKTERSLLKEREAFGKEAVVEATKGSTCQGKWSLKISSQVSFEEAVKDFSKNDFSEVTGNLSLKVEGERGGGCTLLLWGRNDSADRGSHYWFIFKIERPEHDNILMRRER